MTGLRRRSWPLWVAAVCLTVAAVPVFAAQMMLVSDAHVNVMQPAVNSGAISNLRVGGGFTALLQFDLSTLTTGNTSAQVSRAVLRVYCNRVDTAGLVSVGSLGGPWGEYSVTYATEPLIGSAVQVAQVSQAGAYVAFDVTGLVQGWLSAPATNNGVALTAGTAAVQFDSKENDLTGHAAELDVTLASQGPQGPPGSQGPIGLTGAAGPQGFQGPVGLAGPIGPAGIKGDTGPAGPAGATGVAGPQGPQGLPGSVGLRGDQGLQGPQGVQGVLGPTGATGATGPPGPAVANYLGSYASTTNYARHDAVNYAGSTYVSLVNGNEGNTPDQSPAFWAVLAAQGPVGPAGGAGAAGPAGPPGTNGAVGAVGPQGPPVNFIGGWLIGQSYALGDAVSYLGSSYIALTANTGREPDVSPVYWAVLAQAGAAGPAGATGPQGLQGPTGFAGPQGPAGPTGSTGATGPAGAIGPAGSTGPAGPAGVTGPAGPAGLIWRGAYASATNYGLNDAVSYLGASYISAAASNAGNTPDSSPLFWSLLAAQGSAGAQGQAGSTGAQGPQGNNGAAGTTGAPGPAGPAGMNYRGGWLMGNAYSVNDAVLFGGTTYIATAASIGFEPDLHPASWSVLAQGSVGPSGPTGAAATITVGTVTTGSAGTQASVTNTGTSTAAVLNFTLPQGAAGMNGTGGGSGGGSSLTSVYRMISFMTVFYSVNSPNASANEDSTVLTWVPAACTATTLNVHSQQSNTLSVTLRQGTLGSMADTSMSCSVASGGTCNVTGSVPVAAGSFIDLHITGASGTPASVWISVGCS